MCLMITRSGSGSGMIMQVGETIAVIVFSKGKEDCWYCKEKPEKDDLQNQLVEAPSSIGKKENDLKNDSSELGKALGFRPMWSIKTPHTDKKVYVIAAAHHLIPGNASLKRATTLLKYIEKAKGKISGDIGYDVNSRKNGVWLPGSYAVREKSTLKIKWSRYRFQDEYAIRAMKVHNAQFHDSHPDYSKNVLKTLRKIAAKIVTRGPEKCPVCGKTLEDKSRPPYGLVGRLDAVSRSNRKFLVGPAHKWPVISGYFTSKRSKLMKT